MTFRNGLGIISIIHLLYVQIVNKFSYKIMFYIIFTTTIVLTLSLSDNHIKSKYNIMFVIKKLKLDK